MANDAYTVLVDIVSGILHVDLQPTSIHVFHVVSHAYRFTSTSKNYGHSGQRELPQTDLWANLATGPHILE